jgi:Rad3-related DNA helicase
MINLSKLPYKKMRDIQKEVLEKLKNNESKYRYFIIEAPTGTGKSAIAKTICASTDKAFLITATKQLQDQYESDFRDGTITSIKGRANYKCAYNSKLNCEIGPCLVNKDLLNECKRNMVCPYYNIRQEALGNNTALTSYQYFLRSTECGRFWKPRNTIIFDECHLLESQITQWAGMQLLPRELHEKYSIFEGVPFDQFTILSAPPDQSGYANNRRWLNEIWYLVKKRRTELFADIQLTLDGKDPDDLTEEELDELASTHKDYYELDKLFKRMSVFFESNDQDTWIIEPENDGLTIQPVNIGNLFNQYVDKWATGKIIFMSATILDTVGFCKELGLPKEKTAIIRMEPTFPPENSPIIYYPTGQMSYANLDNTIPKIIDAVIEILDKHPNEKGIIHTGNYKIAKAIYDNVNSSRLIMKTNNDESNEFLLKKHMSSDQPTVLVSPSLTTGADLKDDLSRFQIVVKLPFLSLADKRVQKKIKQNEQWYVAEMFRTFVQACGRSTRSDDDWSTTYVLDSSFYYWVLKYRNWFPKQFLKRIVWKKD